MARTNGASELRLSAISSIHLPGGTVFRPYQFCTQSALHPPGCTYHTIFLYIPTIPSSMWDSLLKCRDRRMLWGGQMKNLCLRLVYDNDALHPLFPRTLHQVIRKQGLPEQPCVYRRPPIIYKTRRTADAWQGKHVFVSSHSTASLLSVYNSKFLSCVFY